MLRGRLSLLRKDMRSRSERRQWTLIPASTLLRFHFDTDLAAYSPASYAVAVKSWRVKLGNVEGLTWD